MVPFILEMCFSKFVQFSPFIHVCLLFYCSGFSKFSSKQLVQGLEWFDNSVLFKYKSAKQNSDYCSDGKHKFINCQRTKVEFFNNLALKRKYRKSLKIRSKATCLDCRGSLGNLNKAVFAAKIMPDRSQEPFPCFCIDSPVKVVIGHFISSFLKTLFDRGLKNICQFR